MKTSCGVAVIVHSNGIVIPGAKVTLSQVIHGINYRYTNSDGYSFLDENGNPIGIFETWMDDSITITVEKLGYKPYIFYTVFTQHNQDIHIVIESIYYPNIHIDGIRFKDDNNKVVKLRGFSSFDSIHCDLIGFDTTPHYDEMSKEGFNVPLVFCMWNVTGFNPFNNLQQFYNALSTNLKKLNNRGMMPLYNVFADVQTMGQNHDKLIEFYNQVIDILKTGRAMVKLGNEYYKNGFDVRSFSKPSNIISFSSEPLDDKDLANNFPIWDAYSIHERRDGTGDYPKFMTDISDTTALYDGWFVFKGTHCPIVHTEPIGFGEEMIEGKRTNRPDQANAMAYISNYFCDGFFFHSDDGMFCRLLGPNTKNCLIAAGKGCNNVIG